MNLGIITQARTNSSRLPGKVLVEVSGRTLLDHHLDRLAWAGYPVYIATTTDTADDRIADVGGRRGLHVFRGSEEDVLSRFAGCARTHDLETVVRVTSDCPLIDGHLIRSAIDEFEAAGDPDAFVSNTLSRTFPRGFDFEIFSAAALLEADERATTPAQREHVTPYMHQNVSGRTSPISVTWPDDKSAYRITVDTAADLRVVRTLIEDFGAAALGCGEIIRLLDGHPEIVAVNAHVHQKPVGE